MKTLLIILLLLIILGLYYYTDPTKEILGWAIANFDAWRTGGQMTLTDLPKNATSLIGL